MADHALLETASSARSCRRQVARRRTSLQLYRNGVSSAWNGQVEMPVVTLDLNGETFTIEALANQQIIDLMPETRVPGAEAFRSGIITPRGRVLPWADIRLAFGMRGSEAAIDRRITVAQVSAEGTRGLVGIRTMRSTNGPPGLTQPTHCLQASSCVGTPAVSTVWTDEMTHLVHS